MTNESIISRRSLVAGLGAAIPATAVAAPALAGTDPIFAAIEAHRAIKAELETARDALHRAEKALGVTDWPIGYMHYPECVAAYDGDPAVQAAKDRHWITLNAEEELFSALLATAPTTEAGRHAFMRYGCELEGGPPCAGAPEAYRILAALAGIPEENAPMDDEDEA